MDDGNCDISEARHVDEYDTDPETTPFVIKDEEILPMLYNPLPPDLPTLSRDLLVIRRSTVISIDTLGFDDPRWLTQNMFEDLAFNLTRTFADETPLSEEDALSYNGWIANFSQLQLGVSFPEWLREQVPDSSGELRIEGTIHLGRLLSRFLLLNTFSVATSSESVGVENMVAWMC